MRAVIDCKAEHLAVVSVDTIRPVCSAFGGAGRILTASDYGAADPLLRNINQVCPPVIDHFGASAHIGMITPVTLFRI